MLNQAASSKCQMVSDYMDRNLPEQNSGDLEPGVWHL